MTVTSIARGRRVRQFGTTAFDAFFSAATNEISHRLHNVYISRYPPWHEATLGTPSPDVVFINDTDSGLQVRTSYTSTSLTVSIYGNNEGRRVQYRPS